MGNDVKIYVKNCLTCAKRKAYGPSKAPLKPIEPVHKVWELIAMDFVGPITESRNGNKYILVLSDYATRYVMTFPLANLTAQAVAKILVAVIISKYGAPSRILTDQRSNFLSELVQNICTLFKVKQMNTTAYHPQTDGLVERFNRTLCDMLACYVHDEQELWETYLPFVTLAYNTSVQTSLNETPLYLFYGREPNLPTDEIQSIRYRAIENKEEKYKQEWQRAIEIARENLIKAKNKQKEYYDKQSKISIVKVGQFVLLNAQGTRGKFSNRWDGPYRVTRRISDENIELIVPKEEMILGDKAKFIVHVNRTKIVNFNDDCYKSKREVTQQVEVTPPPPTAKQGWDRPKKLVEHVVIEHQRKMPGKRRGRPRKALTGIRYESLVTEAPIVTSGQSGKKFEQPGRKRRGRTPKRVNPQNVHATDRKQFPFTEEPIQ